ncbi:kinase-like domain-containing protein [Syncephalastrum racemosum]|uniref:Aurora kinase n=1 Tax=Syncephalastrum racemosum TaxID=13706 RepID=A0A1X2HQU4_SYNRA|nr:kinase-like domain-containing protein [Syncephalastrum racemosum]
MLSTDGSVDSPAPVSALVDYTPRRANAVARPDPLRSHGIRLFSRQSRDQYFQKLARLHNNNDHDDNQDIDDDSVHEENRVYYNKSNAYMDSPQVRRYHGVSSKIAKINPYSDRPVRSLVTQREWTADDFDVGRHLGTGRFGTAYLAREKQSQVTVAIKVVKKQEILEANIVAFLKREIEIHAHLRHPNILRLYGYFHDDEHVYMVLEYAAKGDLYTHIHERGPLSESLAAKYVAKILSAIQYLHSLHIIHRDIKPENVLLDAKGELKLADFGWAVHDRSPRRLTFCGTLDYLPPEMINRREHNEKVDVWALGILAYELLVGQTPFEEDEYTDTYNRILNLNYTFPNTVSPVARNFVSKILQYEPRKRPNIADMADHPWIKPYLK